MSDAITSIAAITASAEALREKADTILGMAKKIQIQNGSTAVVVPLPLNGQPARPAQRHRMVVATNP